MPKDVHDSHALPAMRPANLAMDKLSRLFDGEIALRVPETASGAGHHAGQYVAVLKSGDDVEMAKLLCNDLVSSGIHARLDHTPRRRNPDGPGFLFTDEHGVRGTLSIDRAAFDQALADDKPLRTPCRRRIHAHLEAQADYREEWRHHARRQDGETGRSR